MEDRTNFPFKTLIWVLFAALALFIFKGELKQLLTNAEELNIFGIEIKASKDKVNRLQDSIQSFEIKITELSNQITNQQRKISSLDDLKTELEKDLAKCPDAKRSAVLFNSQFNQILSTNTELKTKSDNLKDIKILKRSSVIGQ
jgi:septal ring factor EnvC (AmiA/AmiB activator)